MPGEQRRVWNYGYNHTLRTLVSFQQVGVDSLRHLISSVSKESLLDRSPFLERGRMWTGRAASVGRLGSLLTPTAAQIKHRRRHVSQGLRAATFQEPSQAWKRNTCFTSVRHSHLRESEEDSVRWRYPASDRMMGMIAQVKYGSWNGGQHVTFNSKKPLQAETFRQVLTHLYNKVESLRMCFQYRGDQLWVAEMPQPKIDIKEVAWRDPTAFMLNYLEEPYNMADGPLWHARFMQSPDEKPCSFPEVKKKFPYQYHLFVCYHHAMNDLATAYIIDNLLFSILEDILNGISVSKDQLGSLLSDEYITEHDAAFKNYLDKNPERLKDLLKERVEERTTLLAEAFGVPEVNKYETRMLPPLYIKEHVIEALVSKSLSRGVTLNSTLVAMFNTALVELVREAGVVRDVYTVRTRHPVDLRRYHPDKRTVHLGYHSYPMSHDMPTPFNVRDQFWQYVAKLDKELSDKLKRNHPCTERVIETLLRPSNYSHDGYYSKTLPTKYDLCVSNVYKKSGLRFGIGDQVQITGTETYAQVSHCDFDFVTVIAGFRGQTRVQTIYSTGRMTHNTAQAYASNVFSVMNEVALDETSTKISRKLYLPPRQSLRSTED